MTKLFVALSATLLSMGAYAQDAQQVAADAAKAMNEAPTAAKVEKPSNWTNSLKTNINVGQTGLFNWSAGGDNTVSVAAFIDGNANCKIIQGEKMDRPSVILTDIQATDESCLTKVGGSDVILAEGEMHI